MFTFALTNPKSKRKERKKGMSKSADLVQMRLELRAKFRQEYGSVTAFCRERGISPEWLRLVFAGRYEEYDLLIEAAEFLSRYKAEKQAQRLQKQRYFAEKVASLPLKFKTI